MNFQDYQKQAMTTLHNPTRDVNDFMHRVLGLVGESGEFAEKCKKVFRDNDGVLDEENKKLIAHEMGDVLWYLAVMADYLEINLDDIAKSNLAHLKDRKSRNKIHGSGDFR